MAIRAISSVILIFMIVTNPFSCFISIFIFLYTSNPRKQNTVVCNIILFCASVTDSSYVIIAFWFVSSIFFRKYVKTFQFSFTWIFIYYFSISVNDYFSRFFVDYSNRYIFVSCHIFTILII